MSFAEEIAALQKQLPAGASFGPRKRTSPKREEPTDLATVVQQCLQNWPQTSAVSHEDWKQAREEFENANTARAIVNALFGD